MTSPRPFGALLSYANRGFGRLAGRADLAGGLADLQVSRVCGDCACRLMSHPVVRRLREQAALRAGDDGARGARAVAMPLPPPAEPTTVRITTTIARRRGGAA